MSRSTPVRYLGNRSSGQQGFAIAAALVALGARVSLVSGPVALPDPPGAAVIRVETAAQMLDACRAALPADAAVFAAAVADWRVAGASTGKLKKADGAPSLSLVPNPDILALLAAPGPDRPRLGGRVRGRDRRSAGPCPRQAVGQECGLDRGQRLCAPKPASWAARIIA